MELIQSIDFSVLDFIREHLSCRFLDIFLGIFTTLGNGGIVWIVLAVGLLISKKYRRLGCVMAIGLAFCLLTGNRIVNRQKSPRSGLPGIIHRSKRNIL